MGVEQNLGYGRQPCFLSLLIPWCHQTPGFTPTGWVVIELWSFISIFAAAPDINQNMLGCGWEIKEMRLRESSQPGQEGLYCERPQNLGRGKQCDRGGAVSERVKYQGFKEVLQDPFRSKMYYFILYLYLFFVLFCFPKIYFMVLCHKESDMTERLHFHFHGQNT